MGNWNEILDEITREGSVCDLVRRKYVQKLSDKVERNVILYYSGWLQKPDLASPLVSINDDDKNGLMATVHKLDCNRGLDLILHTPGGDLAATESIVDYLHQKFQRNIRVIVPQIAMSAGTMIACAAKEIIMGKQSSLGPIDPQIRGIPAHGVLEEFQEARSAILSDPNLARVWQPLIAKYPPAFIGECQKAIQWSTELVRDWLKTGMFRELPDSNATIDRIISELGDHSLTLSHARHISADKCLSIGLKVNMMENDQDLQDEILSVHHACMITLASTPAVKIIANHLGTSFIIQARTVNIQRS